MAPLSQRVPALPYALIGVAGILFSRGLPFPPLGPVLPCSLILLAWVGCLARRPPFLQAALFSLVFILAVDRTRASLESGREPGSSPSGIGEGAQVYEGVVTSYPEPRPGGFRMQVGIAAVREGRSWRPFSSNAQLFLLDSQAPDRGARIRFRTKLSAPRNMGNDREWDYEAYARLRGLDDVGSIGGKEAWVEMAPPPEGGRTWLNQLRRRAAERAEVYAGENAPLFRSLVLGELGSVDRSTIRAFRNAGILHLLVVSGSHLALVAWMAAFLAAKGLGFRSSLFGRFPAPYVKLAAGLAGAFLFSLLIDVSVPSLRALVALGLSALILSLHRVRDPILIVFWAAAGMLLANPLYLFDSSWQLSFAATFGIVLGLEACTSRKGIVRLLSASVAASSVTLPVVLFHFGAYSLWTIPGNVIFVPLLGGVATSLGVAATFLTGPFEAFGNYLLVCFDLWLEKVLWLLRFLSALPGTEIVLGRPSLTFLFLLAAGFLLCYRRNIWLAGGLLFSLPLLLLLRPGPAADAVHFLHVGQGDATLLRMREGKNILIDAGPGGAHASDAGERVLLPWFHQHGISRLDLLVVTHGDSDHFGGALSLLQGMEVGEVWLPAGSEVPLVREVHKEAGRRGIPVSEPKRGGSWRMGHGSSLEVLHPPRSGAWFATSENDRSIVLRWRRGNVSFLFPGDLEAQGERELLRTGTDLHARFLKVPHHGSRTSSTGAFLAAVAPRTAVILCGWRNRFHHPAPEIVARYRRRGIDLFRGDFCGEVSVEVGVGEVQLTTHRKCQGEIPAGADLAPLCNGKCLLPSPRERPI